MEIAKRPEELLSEAAERLKRQSPGMTVRGVAGRLEVTPSYWSKVLRGKKPLTTTLLSKVVKVLPFDTQQVAQLQQSILEFIEHDRLAPVTGMRTQKVQSPIKNYQSLGREDFWILEEWFYIPMLNLFTVTGFEPSLTGIARRLGLNIAQVADAVVRLRHKGYLKLDGKGILERTDLKVRFPTDKSYAPVRQYHKAMIGKAREELSQEGVDARYLHRLISSVCFAGSTEKLKEARLILEEAMYKAANLMADEPVCDEVYQLNVQIFPLTRPSPK
jgi:uncharacterized protein (TIGR02147 family)